MWSFWRSRERFSLDELKYLNEQLQRATVINESNKDYVVETLRSMAELLIWGDQHDPSFFEFFMEKQVMADFIRILKNSKTVSVTVQLLQTLNIMLQSMRSEQAIYYMFSNEYINNVITFPFDFKNEELVAYFISFLRFAVHAMLNFSRFYFLINEIWMLEAESYDLAYGFRTISTKLDSNTVSFFVRMNNVLKNPQFLTFYFNKSSAPHSLNGFYCWGSMQDEVLEFPLYTEAIKFARHAESMVRIAVRTLTLHIYNIDDKAIRTFIMSRGLVGYFLELVTSLRQQTFRLVDHVTEAAKSPDSMQVTGRLHDAIAETGDLLYYCNDIINSSITELSTLMTQHIMDMLVIPVLIPSLRPFHETEMQAKELSSLYLLSCILQVVKQKELVNTIGLELLKKSCSNNEVTSESAETSPPLKGKGDKITYESSRELLLSYLFCENDKLVLASLNALVAMLQNKVLNETLLDALGILPQRKRYKKLLLQALVGHNTDDELFFSALPAAEGDDHVDLSTMAVPTLMVRKQQGAEESTCGGNSADHEVSGSNTGKDNYNYINGCGPAVGSGAGHLSPRRNRYQVLDSLMRLLCRRPPPCAEALWHTGWLLRQLLPYHEQKLRDYHLSMLSKAYRAAQEDLLAEIRDCWCDSVPTLLVEEWKICKKASETSALKKDTSFVLWPNPPAAASTGDMPSSLVGERMQSSVKVFVILHQLRMLVVEGSIPDVPLLNQPKEQVERSRTGKSGIQLVTVKRDVEIDLTPGDAIPCRIAFEKGKERSVYLIVCSKGTMGWVLLAEDVPLKQKKGIIRVIAALAGSNPKIDEDHPKWLHLRIRSPQSPMTDIAKLGGGGGRPRSRRLVDGRWTLAFPDEKTCKYAQEAVLEEINIQRLAVQQVLEPLLLDVPSDGTTVSSSWIGRSE